MQQQAHEGKLPTSHGEADVELDLMQLLLTLRTV